MCKASRLFISAALTAFLLSGCYDKIELEDRGFVNSISIDKNTDDPDNPFTVGAELLDMKENVDKNKGDGDGGREIMRQSGEAFSKAMRQINIHSSKSLHYGLAKVCLLGGDLLADADMLREALDAMERSGEINNKLLVLAVAGEAADMLSKEVRDEVSLGFFVTKFYKNSDNYVAATIKLDLEELAAALAGDGSAVIPCLEYDEENKSPLFSGAAVIRSGSLAGYISKEELSGLTWMTGRARGAQILCYVNEAPVPLQITKSSSNLDFYEADGVLFCEAKISVHGVLEEYASGDALDEERLIRLEQLFAESIAQELCLTYEVLLNYGVDGYGLREHLQKWKPGLYGVYGEKLRERPEDMVFTADVTVKITNTGTTN